MNAVKGIRHKHTVDRSRRKICEFVGIACDKVAVFHAAVRVAMARHLQQIAVDIGRNDVTRDLRDLNPHSSDRAKYFGIEGTIQQTLSVRCPQSCECAMANPTGEAADGSIRLDFDRRVKLEFHAARITSDAGLLTRRELDGALGRSARWRHPVRSGTGA